MALVRALLFEGATGASITRRTRMEKSSTESATPKAAPGVARVRWLLPALLAVAGFELLAIATSAELRVAFTRLGFGHLAWLVLAHLWAVAGLAVLLWRVALVARYRPAVVTDDDELPALTVIVPAFNEGRQVYDTLHSVAASDYPASKLRLVAVDDGSVDDTWAWMRRARDELEGDVLAVRCPTNRGKRAALLEGFARARGEVIVTIDSDSEVLPDTLRNLVAPFVREPRVGAVAGNVRVLNQRPTLGRMLDVSFTFSFELLRASQSEVDAVLCCPGALSAYRRDLVEQLKDEWAEQTFLGVPATIGEDRALTNLILREGALVRFQSNAIVLTEVPVTTTKLARMFLRWARSNVRETLVLGRFVFRRFREGPVAGARVNFAWSAVRTLLGAIGFLTLPWLIAARPALFGVVVLGALALALLEASVYVLAREERGRVRAALWAFPYALYSMVALSWISLWALLTPQRSAWLTRDLPEVASSTSSSSVPERVIT